MQACLATEPTRRLTIRVRGDVGEDLGAAAGHQGGESLGLNANLNGRIGAMFMILLS
jgi:hypothetical protein